ncbi:lipase family protein [Nitrosospira sp. NpAV]|uniref:lipase family protein n=1 Tax=Nitrosospira sp. NpAV TaxID=58133 RepID=UPI000696442E|nr:lipase family protein [Nitrosospira sp. NpAV]
MTTWQDLLNPGGATDFFARREFSSFDPEAGPEYSRTNALWLAELCRLFYRQDVEEVMFAPQPSRASFLEKAGLRQRAFFASVDMDTHAMLVEPMTPPSFAILVFRGTDSKRDYVTDMECGLLPWNRHEVGVHKGFRKALDSVWDEIEKELSQLICPIFYTGHSLGAALATLAAARYAPRAVYTFGSPRVGNEAFAASLQIVPIHRVVDNKDAAALLPPEAMGFRHVGLLQLLKEPQTEDKKSFFLELLESLKKPPKLLADHAPVNYVDRA